MSFTSEVVAGGQPGDLCLVRLVRLGGDQREIGQDLADLAWSNHHIRPAPSPEPALTRARRKWRQAHWPELQARALGVADRWGLPTDDTVELATLPLGFPRAGCSVAWLPANRTTTAIPLLSRAFDFTTLTFNQFIGAPPQPGDEPFAGRAYILETRPASGHATLTVTAFDLLSAAVDGINDAGLVAALLSDDESTTAGQPGAGLEPTFAPAVGLSEVELCRYVLERCADVDQALEALRLARHYYFLHPQHFLVADPSGRSFVYEYGPAHNGEHVIWGDGTQIVTNHLLYRYPTVDDLPPEEGVGLTYARFRTLSSLFSGSAELSPEEIAQRHAAVRFTQPGLPVRTLWYALYDPQARSMRVSFHVRDAEQGEVRTPLQEFSLSQAPVVR
jgi:hypothetical protein